MRPFHLRKEGASWILPWTHFLTVFFQVLHDPSESLSTYPRKKQYSLPSVPQASFISKDSFPCPAPASLLQGVITHHTSYRLPQPSSLEGCGMNASSLQILPLLLCSFLVPLGPGSFTIISSALMKCKRTEILTQTKYKREENIARRHPHEILHC